MDRIAQTIAGGSPPFHKYDGGIVAGATTWYTLKDLDTVNGYFWDYFDYWLIQNNSAQPLELYLNTPSDIVPILPYSSQPITGRVIRNLGIKNTGIADTVANEIIISARRMPVNVPVVQIAR